MKKRGDYKKVEDKLLKHVQVKLTQVQAENFRHNAEKKGYSMSSIIRKLLQKAGLLSRE